MSYMALAEGARGLSYYSFDDTYYNRDGIRGVNIAHEFPEFWAGMKGIIQELRAHGAIWTAPYADVTPPTCSDDAVIVSRYPLSDGDAFYLLAVNPTREARSVRLQFAGRSGREPVQEVLADRDLRMTSGALYDTLPSLGVACYRVEADGR
jgi:hypothetical protein